MAKKRVIAGIRISTLGVILAIFGLLVISNTEIVLEGYTLTYSELGWSLLILGVVLMLNEQFFT